MEPSHSLRRLSWNGGDRRSIASSASSSASSSAPSSTSTARPPLNKGSGPHENIAEQEQERHPLLFLCGHPVFMKMSLSPPPVSKGKKDTDGDLELDLESLGLEDREIPPEKLTKLEKIGSGGFKDVFIGKFKGRKLPLQNSETN